MKTLRRKFTLASIASAAVGGVGLWAQTIPAPRAGTVPNDETVQLSEFTVSERALDGYRASESVTGTRVATLIKDLPFSVSVITSEFMHDFDFFDLGSDLAYTASLTAVDTPGNSGTRCPHRVLSRTLSTQPVGDNGLHPSLNRWRWSDWGEVKALPGRK